MKDVQLEARGNLYYVKFSGGGQVPAALTGGYTSVIEANKAVQKYDENKPKSRKPAKKRKVNAPSPD